MWRRGCTHTNSKVKNSKREKRSIKSLEEKRRQTCVKNK